MLLTSFDHETRLRHRDLRPPKLFDNGLSNAIVAEQQTVTNTNVTIAHQNAGVIAGKSTRDTSDTRTREGLK